MKTLLVALNSQYIHSNLAVWYLKACCGTSCGKVDVAEHTINDTPDSVLTSIYRHGADVVAFSCYIWNIEFILKIACDLKKVKPEIIIVLGGPEVSYTPQEIMKNVPAVDYILAGESELSFALLLKRLNGESENTLSEIDGLFSRTGKVPECVFCVVNDLEDVPSPYTDEMLEAVKGKIIYFESSRGCPYSCSYCLSSTIKGVRYFSEKTVMCDLQRLIDSRVRQVKFTDRTFNASKSRAHKIIEYIIGNSGADSSQATGFHFEIYPELLSADTIELLSTAPSGLIQLECGIQSVNTNTLMAVERKSNTEKALANIASLVKKGNIHVHADLVAGLPYENIASFKDSFDMTYKALPHYIQLGFLKLLKGTKLRDEAKKYGYKFREYAPYEILESNAMSFEQLGKLKDLEEILERYRNSGRFTETLKFLTNRNGISAFDFYSKFAKFNLKRGYLQNPMKSVQLYTVLLEFFKKDPDAKLISEFLKFDFFSSHKSVQLPEGLTSENPEEFFEKCLEYLSSREDIAQLMHETNGLSPKNIYKNVRFEMFRYDIFPVGTYALLESPMSIVFDHTNKDKVTGRFRSYKLY